MNTTHLSKQVILRRKEEKRLLAGHPWVFSNEVRETVGAPAAGDVAELLDAGGRTLGIGFYHPNSLIAFRLLSRQIEEVGHAFFHDRINQALATRTRVYPGDTTYRVVHGEADFLPGLVVDKYNEVLCVQAFSSGMDRRLGMICDVLDALFHPRGIVERNETPVRQLEGLPQRAGVLRGRADPTIIEEHGLQYAIDPIAGQKTGFFLDQRDNRKAIIPLCNGATVLDCFCNDGGFALNAARGGASTVLGFDSSESSISRARANAQLNNIDVCAFEVADVFESIKLLRNEEREFDMIILDPPSFTRSRKNVQNAKQGYRNLHRSAAAILKKGGYL
ncbi:MAG: class I SAM-dependent rRNA methyltransferase, partial [Bacteroidetes bacterium]|nr:class I SAM-dependent rRNA methyltransferase [Bacteroidota bacterium]